MNEIQKFATSPLHNIEYFGFLTKVKEATSSITVESDQQAIQSFIEAYDAYDSVLKTDRVNSYTAKLQTASDTMDKTWRGLKRQTQSMTTFSNEERRDIALRAFHIIERYGDLPGMGHNEKNAAAHNLLQDFAEMGIEKQKQIAVDIWVAELAENNAAFLDNLMAQAAETGERGKGNTKRLRDEADEQYQLLVKRVNSIVFLNGNEPYRVFIDYVNVFIDDAKAVIAARKTRAEHQKDEDVVDPDLPINPPTDPDLPAI